MKEEGLHCEISCNSTFHKRWKSLSFCKIGNNPILLCYLLDTLTNKHCRACSPMIALWIDSRTCQENRILLSARQRSKNYLEISKKKNVLWKMMLSHWPSFISNLFMIWFHKIIKLVFKKQPSCPWNIWRKTTCFHSFLDNFLIP